MTILSASVETILRAVAEEVTDFAIFLVDQKGVVTTWTTGAQHIYGFARDEIVGRSFDLLFTEDDRRAGAPQRELTTAREQGRADDTRWHRRNDGSLFFADGVTTAIRDGEGRVSAFIKIARDITARYQAEQRLATQLALARILTEEHPFEESARRILETICTLLGWDIGVLWRATAVGDMDPIESWARPGTDEAVLRPLCGQRLSSGVGLPGRVFASREPVWIFDFGGVDSFPRAPFARSAGIAAAFAFPMLHEGRVNGVLEFFSYERREPDQALLPVMALVGAQIGDYIARRETASALRASEERYRIISQTAQDAIFTIDEQSTILFCNPAVERVFGYKPEELVGQKLTSLIPERFRTAHQNGLNRYTKTGRRNIPWSGVELPGLHRDGHEIPLEISFGEWRGEDVRTFTGFARDITDRKRALEQEQKAREEAEAARAQLERRAEEEAAFRHLASALSGAVEMTDVLYEITNRATLVTRADGVYVERIISPNRDVEVVSAAGRGVPRRGLRIPYPGSMTEEILERRRPVILTDMTSLGPSMSPYLTEVCADCEVLVTPLFSENEPLGALVLLNSRESGRSFRDGDIVRARTLGDLTSLALRRVRLLEQERDAKERAEAAVRVRDETLGIVSHDLRNPLTQISLAADLLRDLGSTEERDYVETIRAASKQAQRLIEDLLDVARLESGRLSVQLDDLDPADIVRRACEMHEAMASQRQQKIVCTTARALPLIRADRERLLQVFGNLIGNALKFTPPRGTITIDTRTGSEGVIFTVTDTGAGIPEADLKSVFRPYWQAKKTAHMGAGLGLAIVRGIIEAHGGRVWAANAAGGGAQFAFTIPVAK